MAKQQMAVSKYNNSDQKCATLNININYLPVDF